MRVCDVKGCRSEANNKAIIHLEKMEKPLAKDLCKLHGEDFENTFQLFMKGDNLRSAKRP